MRREAVGLVHATGSEIAMTTHVRIVDIQELCSVLYTLTWNQHSAVELIYLRQSPLHPKLLCAFHSIKALRILVARVSRTKSWVYVS